MIAQWLGGHQVSERCSKLGVWRVITFFRVEGGSELQTANQDHMYIYIYT